MLNIFIYNREKDRAVSLKKKCIAHLEETGKKSEVVKDFSDSTELYTAISSSDKISLYMLKKDNVLKKISGCIREINDMSYIVLILNRPEEMLESVTPAARPSGILLDNPDDQRLGAVLDEIYADYARLPGVSEINNFYSFRIRGIDYKVQFCRMVMIEVQSKKITIRTESQIFEFYDSLETVMKNSPDYFIRVHRSFVVNTNFIKMVNYSEKTIYMNDGSTVFFSRTYSNTIKEYLRNTLKENFF